MNQQHFDPNVLSERQLSNEKLIRDRRLFVKAAILYAVLFILSIRFPHGYTWFEGIMNWLGIPTVFQIGNNTRIILTGLPLLIGVIVMLRMLARSLSRKRVRIGIMAFLLLVWAPNYAVNLYQTWFGEGIYALQFEQTIGRCQLQHGVAYWKGECSLKAVNYESRTVRAYVTLHADDLDGTHASLKELPLGEVDFSPGHSVAVVKVHLPDSEANSKNSTNVAVSSTILFQQAVVTDGKRVRNLSDTRWRRADT
ncbi:hypothetical protein LQV63_01180 [Paenibacillus profundus]|uniref:Uncharacterized protein n=1 Tax=Paenibacillus profundus TaxID=1173085 RepID=A0ABS8YAT1_9BACL|nr:hypothetical protein [Paenibacillus profundus]MCE5167929.1 hypothetical protein [Paenibacillus profundus]